MKKGVVLELDNKSVGRIFTCLLVFIAVVLLVGCFVEIVHGEDAPAQDKSKVDYKDPSTWSGAKTSEDFDKIAGGMQGMCMGSVCSMNHDSTKQKEDIKKWFDNPANADAKNQFYSNVLKSAGKENLNSIINSLYEFDKAGSKYVKEFIEQVHNTDVMTPPLGIGTKYDLGSLWKTKELTDDNKKMLLNTISSYDSKKRDDYVNEIWNRLEKDGKPDAAERQKLLDLLNDDKLKDAKLNLINSIQKAGLEKNPKYGKKFADSLKDAVKLDKIKTKYSVDADGKEHLYLADSKGNGKFDLLDPSVMFKGLEEKDGVLNLNYFTNKPEGTDTVTLKLGLSDLDNLPGEIKISNNFEVKDGKRNFQKGFGDLSIGNIKVGNPFFGSGNREISISADDKGFTLSGKGNAVINYYEKSGETVTKNIFARSSTGKEATGFLEIFTKKSDGSYSTTPAFKNADVFYTLTEAYNKDPYSNTKSTNVVVRADSDNLFSIDSVNIKMNSQTVKSYETKYTSGGCSGGSCGGSYQQTAVDKQVNLYDIDVKNVNGITILGNNLGLSENEMVRFNVDSSAVGVKTAYLDNNRVTNVVSYADNPNPNMFVQDYQGTEQSGLLFNPLPSKGEVVTTNTPTISSTPVPTDNSANTDKEVLPGFDPAPIPTKEGSTGTSRGIKGITETPTTETPTTEPTTQPTTQPTTTPTETKPADPTNPDEGSIIPGDSGPSTGTPNDLSSRIAEVNNALGQNSGQPCTGPGCCPGGDCSTKPTSKDSQEQKFLPLPTSFYSKDTNGEYSQIASGLDVVGNKQDLMDPTKTVAIKFGSPGCSWCVKMDNEKVLETASGTGGTFVRANTNDPSSAKLAKSYGITGIPVIVYLRGGKEVDRINGYTDDMDRLRSGFKK